MRFDPGNKPGLSIRKSIQHVSFLARNISRYIVGTSFVIQYSGSAHHFAALAGHMLVGIFN